MRKLRVVTMVDHLEAGGAERLAVALAVNLDVTKFESIVCSTRTTSPGTLSMLSDAGVRVVALGRGSPAAVWRWAPLVKLLRKERIDVLHAHKFGSNAWASVIGPLGRVPAVIATEHTWSYEGGRVRRLVDRHVVGRGASAIVAVSEADRRRMEEIEKIPARKLCIVPNPLLPSPRSIAPRPLDLGIPAGARVIGTVCVLRPQKALGVLLEALARLRTTEPDVHLVVAGDGDERSALEERASQLGVAAAVRFIGRRDDVADVLATFDVFVSSSDFEGTPLAMIEAMAAGLPIVATAVGGVPELLGAGDRGLLVPRRDPAALADAVGALLRDEPRAALLGTRARHAAATEHSFAGALARWQSLYERLAAR